MTRADVQLGIVMLSPTHEAALEYARRGWHVFPIEVARAGDADSGKRPLGLLAPRGKDDATVDLARVNEWWGRVPEANVGIALAPSRLCVLDVDVGVKKDGTRKRGAESLRELEAGGALESTLTAITGGSGLHAYYVAEPDVVASKIGFRDGLDLIVNGYVVAPPSRHHTGGTYRWSDERRPAKLPPRLAEVAREPKSRAKSIDAGADVGAEQIPEGGRNNALFRLGCALRDTGIGDKALRGALHFENQRRFSPPLPDDELNVIAESVMRRVQPSRDVALGAVIEDVARGIQLPVGRARWARDVASDDAPPTRFYATGFAQLDALLGGGLCTRQVCGVVGPPSAGKSAFVGSVVDHVARSIPVLQASTELPRDELAVRAAALRGGFPWRDGMRGAVPRARMRELLVDHRVKLLGSDDMERDDALAGIFREAEALRDESGVGPLVVIDYVQLLARGAEDKIRARVGELTMRIRQQSQALDLPVLAVFSTKRDFYNNATLEKMREADDPTAYLAAAKESGDIEFDCATILFLDVDKLHEGQPKPARVAVARCRVGDVGFVGARAQLDVGKWWGDPSASGEVTGTARDARKAEDRSEKEALRVLEIIGRMPGRTWKEYRRLTGWGGPRADAARDRLLAANRLRTEEVVQHDKYLRPIKRELLVLTGAGNIDPQPGVKVVTP